MSDRNFGLVEVDTIEIVEEGGVRQQGRILQSITELRDMFFGENPLFKYKLKVTAATPRGAELRGRRYVRMKHPLAPDFIGIGRVRRSGEGSGKGEFNVTVNVRG